MGSVISSSASSRRAPLRQPRDDVAQGAGQHAHDREMVVDEAKLGVQAHVFVDMARGVVRLGAEHRAHLVHALEHADHDLLVELRRLRQVGLLAEVVHAEDVGPALARRRQQFGRLDLGEALAVQVFAVGRHDGRLHAEQRAPRRVPQPHGGVVQERVEPGLDHRLVDRERQRLGHGGHQAHGRLVQLEATARLRLRDHAPLDRDHRFRQCPRQRRQALGLLGHGLRDAVAVADQQEADAAQRACLMEPALHRHPLARVGRQVGRSYSFHVAPPAKQKPPALSCERTRGVLVVPPFFAVARGRRP